MDRNLVAEARKPLPESAGAPLMTALMIAQRFGPVLPLRKKEPLTRHGVKDATRDEGRIRAWWAKWPDADIGLATGPGSVEVLDVDPGGTESLAALVKAYGPLPETRQHKTGRGVHFLFAPSGIPNTVAKIGRGLDTKGAGGYVKWWPVLHDLPVASAPPWLVALARGGDPLAEAEAIIAAAPVGTRNVTLSDETFRVARMLDPDSAVEAEERLVSASSLPPREASRTVRSGLKAGFAAARRERGRFRPLPIRLWSEPAFARVSPDAKLLALAILSGSHSILVPGVAIASETALAEETGLSEPAVRAGLRDLRRRGLLRRDARRRVLWLVPAHRLTPPWSVKAAAAMAKALAVDVPPCAIQEAIRAALAEGAFGPVFVTTVTLDARGRPRVLKPFHDPTWPKIKVTTRGSPGSEIPETMGGPNAPKGDA